MITLQQVKQFCPKTSVIRLSQCVDSLNQWMPHYGIVTPDRVQQFMAQVAWESSGFSVFEEYASGKAYDTGRLAERLGNTPEPDGDGQKYKGRGAIQLTGHDNYVAFKKDTGIDVVNNPELLLIVDNAIRVACWFWWKHGLNSLADQKNGVKTTKAITVVINGGTNGLTDRIKLYNNSKAIFI